ncbi:MAG: glycosyltransferase family 25 protein [Pseudomonadota bacterium]
MDSVHVISLARSQARRAAFALANAHLRYEFVDAVDGTALTPEQVAASGHFAPGLPYIPGAIGCALSHLGAWERAIALGRPITVAEDDAVFRHDFHEKQWRLLSELPPHWDIVMWGWNFDCVLSLNLMPGVTPSVLACDQTQLRRSLAGFQQGHLMPALLPLNSCFGTPAYTISASGARRFRAMCFPLRPMEVAVAVAGQPVPNVGIDVAMNRAYPLTGSYACVPPLAATPNDHGASTVRHISPLADPPPG